MGNSNKRNNMNNKNNSAKEIIRIIGRTVITRITGIMIIIVNTVRNSDSYTHYKFNCPALFTKLYMSLNYS